MLTATHASAPAPATAPVALPRRIFKCRVCWTSLRREDGDDVEFGVCSSCKSTPEAADLGPPPGPAVMAAASQFAQLVQAAPGALHTRAEPVSRPFTEADISMIRKVGAFMPAQQLLDILNERLIADVGRRFAPYSMEQLKEALNAHHGEAAAANVARDWSSLRRLLGEAHRSGLLALIDEQLINDFAVVFQLTAKQVVDLKDILLSAAED